MVDFHGGVTKVSLCRVTLGVTSKPHPLQPTACPGVESNSGSAVWISCKALSVLVTSFYQHHVLQGFLTFGIPAILLGACNAVTFHSGLNLPCSAFSTWVCSCKCYSKRPVVKAFSVFFSPVVLMRNAPACGCENAMRLTRSSEVVSVSQHTVWVAVGWCRNSRETWVPWCGSREAAAFTTFPRATEEAFAVCSRWVITGVPPLPSAFQAAWCMSCGSYLLESMHTELIRSGMLAPCLLYERINAYLDISLICTVN